MLSPARQRITLQDFKRSLVVASGRPPSVAGATSGGGIPILFGLARVGLEG
jgi:hypothetical protein